MSYSSSTNYTLINENKKDETTINWEKLPEVKESIISFLKKDSEFWEKYNAPSQGVEKNNLIQKVCEIHPVNSAVIYRALDDLMVEQVILPMQLDNFIRFVLYIRRNPS